MIGFVRLRPARILAHLSCPLDGKFSALDAARSAFTPAMVRKAAPPSQSARDAAAE
jgi:hypothetical protein